MTYPEQLDKIQWKNKRTEILKRDSYKCQNCSNENLVSEFDKGFFSGFCFPNSQEAIHIDNFGTVKFMRSGIKKNYSKFLKESAVVYSKKIPKWKRMILGIRKLDSKEKVVFEKYSFQINELKKKFKNSFDHDRFQKLVDKNLELKEKRRIEFIELNKRNNKKEFEWIFMLGLHIHHKYYIKGFNAWEYKNNALITLCQSCHENLHKNQKIPVYNRELELLGHYKYCERCHGAGVFPEYSHVQNGICFRCHGLRYEELITNANTV